MIPLTLIIPAYNRQSKVERALESLVDQDVRLQEIIIVDDGSVPHLTLSRDIVSALNVSILRHDINLGVAAARNSGMVACTSEWVTFLDSDDWLAPQTLGRRWRQLCHDQSVCNDPTIIYGCSWFDCDTDAKPLQIRHPHRSDSILDFAGSCWFSPGSCIIVNRDRAIKAAGSQDESLRRLEDFDWFLSLALHGFRFRPQTVIGAFIERSRNQDPTFVTQNVAMIRQKWRASDLDRASMARMESYMSLEIAVAHYFAKNHGKACFWFARSFFSSPRFSIHLAPGWTIEQVAR